MQDKRGCADDIACDRVCAFWCVKELEAEMGLCLFFPQCLEVPTPPRRVCEHHLLGWCDHMGIDSPALLDRTWIPAPEFDIALAKRSGVSVRGLSQEQIAMLGT